MRLPRPSISLPRPGVSLRGILALVIVLTAAGAGWYFLIRDDSASSEKTGKAEKARTERVKEDPAVRGLSIEERVNQVLMLGFDGTAPGQLVSALGDAPPGAVILGPDNWPGKGAGIPLVAAIRKLGANAEAGPPLAVAAQEGGVYRSYPDLPPDARELDIGREANPKEARAWAKAGAGALKSAGFGLNLFPVVDIATLDSPLAGRSFSDDPGEVTTLTTAALAGCADAGLACAPLHFPGLGASSQDTAEGPATIQLDAASLQARDLQPFLANLRGLDAVVVSLGLYSAYDPITPAALSPDVTTGLLRDQLGFKGVAISDDLSAGAVQATYSAPDAAVAALGAGIDLIQISDPRDQGGVAKALVEAVDSGQIPPQRLAEAATRVIHLKDELGSM